MINFFRRIRQKLVSENRFSQYVIYALGEIILVVIGILLALQINNWNEEAKLNKLTQTYYEQILIDLDAELFNIQENKDFIRNKMDSYEAYIKNFKENDWTYYQIISELGKVEFGTQTPLFNDNTFQTLKQTGDIKLLPIELRNKLIALERKMTYMSKIYDRNTAIYLEHMEGIAMYGFNDSVYRYMQKPLLNEQLNNYLLTDKKVVEVVVAIEGLLRNRNSSNMKFLESYTQILEQINEVKSLVHSEIQ